MSVREFFRFLITGGLNTLISYVVYLGLLQVYPYIISYTISYVASIFSSYILHSKLVYKENLKLSKAATYPVMYLGLYFLNTGVLYLLVEKLLISKELAPILVVFIIIPITYILGRFVIKGRLRSSRK
ncbi:MAG: GtrA family protein [Mucilaginibacter sp.]